MLSEKQVELVEMIVVDFGRVFREFGSVFQKLSQRNFQNSEQFPVHSETASTSLGESQWSWIKLNWKNISITDTAINKGFTNINC